MQHICTSDCTKIPQLQEFILPEKLICAIPSQALKGLHNIPISLTCLDVCGDYAALGSNIGIVYLYNEKTERLQKLRNDDYKNPVTCVKILISLECLVIVGCEKGTVLAFKVPLNDKEEVEKFIVEGLHNTSVVALEWVKNGIKFFSGDSSGLVVSTEIDHLEHQSRSKILLVETAEIVQLSYQSMNLLVSTRQKSFIYSFKENDIIQIGQKERKTSGNFGAVFYDSNGTVFASRPGQRLWKSDISGIVSETIILKTAINNYHHTHSLSQDTINFNFLKDFQISVLKIYDSKYLLTWSQNVLLVINPTSQIITSIHGFQSIVDVACNEDKIFVLQGIRHIIRLAVSKPDDKVTTVIESPSILQEILVPLKEISKHSSKLEVPKLNEAPKFFDWLKKKVSDVNISDDSKTFNNEEDMVNSIHVDENPPDIVKLDSDLTPINIDVNAPPPKPFDKFSSLEMDDEIVYKPKKKIGKKKKNVTFMLEEKETDEMDSNSKVNVSVDNTENNNSNSSRNNNLDSSIENNNPDSSIENNNLNVENNSTPNLTSNDINENSSNNIELYNNNNHMLVSEGINSSSNNNNFANISSDDNNTTSIPITNSDITDNPINVSEDISNCNSEPTSPIDIYSSITFSVNSNEHNDEEEEAISTTNINANCDNNQMIFSNMTSSDTFDDEVPKYGVDWIQYDAPGPVLSLSISNYHIFCADNQNALYISSFPVLGVVWKKLQQPAEQISVSPSEEIIWILYKGTVYAAKLPAVGCWKNVNWIPFARDVTKIAVGDTSGWYVTTNGTIIRQQSLSASKPYNYPEEIPGPSDIAQITCRGEVVWLLTSQNKLHCKIDNLLNSTLTLKWKEIKFECIDSISKVCLGANNTAFIIDSTDKLWFRNGVTPETPEGLGNLWLVESSNYLHEMRTQSMNSIVKSITKEMFSNLIKYQSEFCLTASEGGVWYCKEMMNTLYCNHKYIIGHIWDVVVPSGTVLSMTWSLISAKGILNSKGLLWACNNVGDVFCFTDTLENGTAIELPYKACIKCLEPTPESLWILTTNGNIYIRRDISEKNPQGVWWHKLNLTQLSDVQLTHISCSFKSVWACDNKGNVYIRLGSLNPSTNVLSQAWVNIDSSVAYPKPSVIKVYIGSAVQRVWAIDDKNNVFMRDGITCDMPVGEKWVYIPSPPAKQLCISNRAVWLLSSSGEIYRRFGISHGNNTGDYWKEIPGNINSLSVTCNDDLWGISSETIHQHASYTLDYLKNYPVKTEDVIEADWEDITMSDEF